MPEPPHQLSDEQDAFLPLGKMAKVIAIRIRPAGEPMRITVDKVRKRLTYAVKNVDLQTVDGLYPVPGTIAWARKKWPDKLNDLHADHSSAAQSTGVLRDEAWSFVIPGDLPRCQEALQECLRQVRQLQEELKTAHTEIERLKPVAEKYEKNRETNRRSAKQPRKGAW